MVICGYIAQLAIDGSNLKNNLADNLKRNLKNNLKSHLKGNRQAVSSPS
ncbi:hypothetical protein ACFY2W_36045 [Streptomyces sp. NPDC001262]